MLTPMTVMINLLINLLLFNYSTQSNLIIKATNAVKVLISIVTVVNRLQCITMLIETALNILDPNKGTTPLGLIDPILISHLKNFNKSKNIIKTIK